MNRLFITLIGASIAALVLAVGCGSWLFLQSWKDGQRLERQNRELKASLEASRIRLENFCEYPAEALCNIDEPRGSVSGAMSGFSAPAMPEPVPAASGSTPPQPEKQQSQSSLSAKSTLPAETEAPRDERPAAVSGSMSSQLQMNEAADNLPQKELTGEKAESEAGTNSDSDSSDLTLSSDRVKKTWTSIELKKNIMMLHIAGEGTSLTGKGRLLSDPLRYEVTLDGLWNIFNRHPQNALVKDMQTSIRRGNTVLTFPLSKNPAKCSVRQDDGRTITIIIR